MAETYNLRVPSTNPLQTIRSAHRLVRRVLVWFVLSLGVAVASPLVNPQSTELICSGTGVMKLLVKNADGTFGTIGTIDDGGTEFASRMLDCPLCASVSAPPPGDKVAAAPDLPPGPALQAMPAAHITARTAAPPPGRGPPLIS